MSPPLIEQSKSDLLVGLIYQFSRYAFKHVENDVINRCYIGINICPWR
jgi:hypothetical protein